MVYPALTYLEEIGHATVEADSARKLYRITASGQEHLEANRGTAEDLFTQFTRVGERMDRVRRAMHAQETEDDVSVDHERGGSRDFHRARKELKLALLDKWDGSREEQQRIVAILKRATAEISGQ
jgi:DNA-binding PadR family transcriptional regulator